jgi:uncharacterized membrane protein
MASDATTATLTATDMSASDTLGSSSQTSSLPSPAEREVPGEIGLRGITLRSIATLLLTIASVLAVVADWRSPVRSVLALGFLLFAPGLAITEMLAIREPFQRLALATAGSLALDTVVGVTLLYAGAFSINLALALLAGLVVAALVVAIVRARRSAAISRDRGPHA